MPRKRKTDTWLPPRVYKGKSAYEWRPAGGGAVRLCGLDASRSEVYAALEQEKRRLASIDTLEYISGLYFGSREFLKLKGNTQGSYIDSSKKPLAVFGRMHPDHILPVHIRQYMDKRGLVSESRANKEKSFLSVLLSWAYERGYMTKENPCKSVRNFSQKPRTRYITDEEYQSVYDKAPPNVQAAMEIAYLCAARQRDILDLTVNDIQPEGLHIEQNKTGKRQIKKWTPRLRRAVELARAQPSRINTLILIHTKDGSPYSSTGFKSLWKRAKAGHNFTFHDIKAKGISDFEGDKQQFSGHESKKIVDRVYNRKAEIVDILDK